MYWRDNVFWILIIFENRLLSSWVDITDHLIQKNLETLKNTSSISLNVAQEAADLSKV